MSRRSPQFLESLRFRTSDRYELVLHDRLGAEEKRRFEPLTKDPDHWGVLRPRGPGNYRAIDRDTALLLFTLREPGPLPEYVVAGDEDGVARSIRSMVFDGILDAETPEGERVRFLDEADDSLLEVDARSLAALRYGAALEALDLKDARTLSIRLYLYGGEPLRRSVCDRLATRLDVLDFLGLTDGGATRSCLPAGWRLDDRPEKEWIFLRRKESHESSAPPGRGRCKLYVGCAFDDVPRVVRAVVVSLAGSGARSMKVGSSAVDLVRADKIIVYFDAFEALQGFAAALSERLDELGLADSAANDATGLGVPFSAPAGGGGLLSWGVDPPDEAIVLRGTFTESWRAWVAARVAAALVSIRSGDEGHNEDGEQEQADRRLRAVLERVRLDGVDTRSWTPTEQLWNEAP